MEEAFADWDLLAVVRSCSTTTTTTSPPPPPPSSPSSELLFGLPTLFEPTTTSLQDDNSNNTTPKFQSFSSSSSSSVSSSLTPSVSSCSSSSFGIGEPPLLRRLVRPSQVVFGPPNTGSNNPQQPLRTKKRKNLIKKVCHVPAEGLSNDMWAWRKYGQKPIKGSPYPRGYYRCSSSKGCLARKQVERNRSDPKMFIVTYTAEHNHPMPTHRNSLAGSTRQKTIASTATGDATQSDQATTCSSPSAASLSSPTTEKSESKADGDDLMMELDDDSDMGLSDLMLNDDFYVGFEKIDGEDTDDCFSDHFSPPMEFPWLTNSSPSGTATAAGGI